MFEDKWSFDRIRSGKVGRGVLRGIGIQRKGILRIGIIQIVSTGDGAGLAALSNMHRRVEPCQLDTIPERTPDEPRLILIVDDEVRIDGIPVVATFTGGDDAEAREWVESSPMVEPFLPKVEQL